MSQKNDTPVLVVSLLVTIGLLGAGFWWFTRQSTGGLGGLLGSSSSLPNETANETAATTSPPPAVAESFAGVPNVPSGLFSYGGSTTWAPVRGEIDPLIQTVFPQFRLQYRSPLSGTPGSGTGIRMLLDNQLAFAQSSRPLTTEEYQEAQQRGFTLKEIPVALEGIAIAVHPSLAVTGLTIEQLRDIYTGQITNWNQVGGPNLPISVYSRPNDGGTVDFFIENILNGSPFSRSVQIVPTTTQALRDVAANPGGIYYASAPEIVGQCTTKPMALGVTANQWVAPYQEPLIAPSQCPAQRNQINSTALQSGEYPITRRLFVIVKQDGQADQQAGETYANLLLTAQGQNLLNQAGFVSIR
ncbi:PstS family phosphate ABC transporter substrate-binding protein [Oculatella sp. LEGE 06141]|uniref:PstS family phosphate ABC transporter substrate-binding protein n=1 Tax=Oculatella sp. LEGE 06141 TaxID=1828648 RepID=UPI0018821FFA|nr:PstS family phosphate ABC transporter substrate-binding protein [Oculatella sp. LEGE 06141]MBE9178892.1 PstS family phosphate ABC transporter substrate-binding protein [Oculatella sp. LEGE 06141]